ncbi:MAG: hypothetical protein L0312_21230, partial [Acidobacteria bacterium]|nr:hypothetical protein [Acidobacteriota bacterium]
MGGASAGFASGSLAATLGSGAFTIVSSGGAGFGASATGSAGGFDSTTVFASTAGSGFAGFFLTFFPEKWS